MCKPYKNSALENPEMHKVWVYWVAVFVPPTSKQLMHGRSVRFTTCLAAMDAQLLSSCQDSVLV